MEGWNDCKSDRVAAFPHSIVPSVRTRRLESVLVRNPALLRHSTRCRTGRRLDSIVNPSTPDTINLGRIALSDLFGDIDFQLVFPQGHGITAYLVTGVSIHARNGSGAAINGTFVEDALDVITAGLNGTLGFEFNLSRAWRFTVDGRGVLSSGLKTVSLRTGIMYRLQGGRERGVGSRAPK